MSKKESNQQIMQEMIDHISKEGKLRQILIDNNIAEIEKIHEFNCYQKEGGRRGLIVDVQEKNADKRSKIMIDLKIGEPTVNQVYDALYGIGKDCYKRIIVYSNGQNEFDNGIPTADFWPVNGLINNLQQYPLGLHLLEMNNDNFNVGPHWMQEYYEPDQEYSISEAPTREQFMAEVFWIVYFDSFSEGRYEPFKTFDGDFRETSDWGHIIYIDCSFFGEIQLYWDQEGVNYRIKLHYDCGESMKMVLNYEMPWLQEHYGADAVKFDNDAGKVPELRINYSDRPFDWLYTAHPLQITEFAKSLHDDAWGLRWRFEDRIDELLERNQPGFINSLS
jgi:hypothetical protein